MLELLRAADKKLFLYLNGMHNSFFDDVMSFASDRFIWIPFYALLLLILINEYKYKALLIVVMIAAMITVSDQFSSAVVKNSVQRLRPCHNPELQSVVHTVNNVCGGLYGYFSSHASNATSLALFLFLILRRSGKKQLNLTGTIRMNSRVILSSLIFYALLVSYSRIYLGSHYPFDVITGIVFGTILSFIFAQLFFYFSKPKTQFSR